LLHPYLLEFGQHGTDLPLRQHEIAHRHRVAPRPLEGNPRTERECRLDGDSFDHDPEIAPRKAVLADAAGLRFPLTTHDAVDRGPLRGQGHGLPRCLGRLGLAARGECKTDGHYHHWREPRDRSNCIH
jgi:hypothetical protein